MEQKRYLQSPDVRNLLLVSCLYLIFILFSFLYTIYPLDDDWSYIRAAQTFYQTGQMKFTPWTSPSLIFQVWWGALFAHIFGFSINILIVSTLVISFFGSVFFYLLLREAEWEPGKSILIVLLFIFNPFSFPLLYTFFTDHHFLGLMFISIFFYFRGAKRGGVGDLLLGSLFASCAVLVRQQGVLIAAGAGLYLFLSRQPKARAVSDMLISIALPGIAFLGFSYWFQNIHGPTYSSLQQTKWIVEGLINPVHFFSKIFHRPILILEFFGISLIPLSLALLPPLSDLSRRRHLSLILIFCLAAVLFYLTGDHLGIYSSIYSWMNGFHFAFVSEYGHRGSENILLLLYKLIDFLAIFSITYLIFLIIRDRKRFRTIRLSSPLIMLLIIGLLQVSYLMIVRFKFTRYYLVLLPFFVWCACEVLKNRSWQKKYFIPLLTGCAVFSVMGTQDFLSWNETRWKLGSRLLQQGTPSLKISGGFPWDCWHNMDYCLHRPHAILPRAYDIPWWFEELTPAIDPEYLISSSPIPTGFFSLKYFYTDRYVVVDSAEYYSLLYLKKMKVYVLRRVTPAGAGKEGKVYYSFLDNFNGAEVLSDEFPQNSWVGLGFVRLAGRQQRALVQPTDTLTTFRLSIPPQGVRLTFSLSAIPEMWAYLFSGSGAQFLRYAAATPVEAWGKGGDGVLCKILLNTHLIENLFEGIGMVGVEQKMSFLKPRTYFFASRTAYLRYLNPQLNPADGSWQQVTLDMSRFSGMTMDISFAAEPGPAAEVLRDVALWGDPVIETY